MMSSSRTKTILAVAAGGAAAILYSYLRRRGAGPSQALRSVLHQDDIEVSAEDERKYRIITLANDLECLLVSDPTTEKASAALDVNVGHFSDPDHLPGLAHFLEHMLFLGTGKYPDEAEYNAFLSANGGGSNAYTSQEHTNYYFDVSATQLEEALDRFAQFFIDPLFTAAATNRELNAVHNENQKNLQTDSRRFYQLLKSHAPHTHPFHKFGTGNKETLKEEPERLGIDVRKALLRFHKKFYSANIMKLVVVGRESLDELQDWVVTKFSPIPNKKIQVPTFTTLPSPMKPAVGKIFRIVPIKDQRKLKIRFPFPEVDTCYRSAPNRCLSHYVGHESTGSIFAVLREKLWANSLMAGVGLSSSCFADFSITIDLTEQGFSHIDDMIKIVFGFIGLMHELSEAQWKAVHEEAASLSANVFRFKGKEAPYSYSCHLASRLNGPIESNHVLSKGYLRPDFDYQAIKRMLSYLSPDNFFVDIIAKDFEGATDRTERWYGTQYSEEPLSQELLDQCQTILTQAFAETDGKEGDWVVLDNDDLSRVMAGLRIPGLNPYVPNDFGIVAPVDEKLLQEWNATGVDNYRSPTAPQLMIDEDHCRWWYSIDNIFRKPKLYISLRLYTSSSVANATPRTRILTVLMGRLIDDMLNEETYNASEAGLDFSVSGKAYGLSLDFGGYHEKLPALVKMVVKRIVQFTDVVSKNRFEVLKEKQLRTLRNHKNQQPYVLTGFNQDMVLEQHIFDMDERREALEEANFDDLKAVAAEILNSFYVEGLVYGNIDAAKAKAVSQDIMADLEATKRAMSRNQVREYRSVQLAEGVSYFHRAPPSNPQDSNSCVRNLYQFGECTPALLASTYVFAQIISEPCFSVLRTQEQLGYIVWSGPNYRHGVLGLRITVQSSNFSADYLDQRIEAFLHDFGRNTLRKTTAEDFEKFKAAVLEDMTVKPKSPGRLKSQYFSEIQRRRYHFSRVEERRPYIQRLTLDDVIAFYDTFLAVDAPRRARLSTQLFGPEHGIPAVPGVHGAPTATPVPVKSTEEKTDTSVDLLPPAPTSTMRVEHITDFAAFRSQQPLFPSFESSLGEQNLEALRAAL